jgi:hypothetical protein
MPPSLWSTPYGLNWNPLAWSSATFVALIVVSLVIRVCVPRLGSWPTRLAREVLLVVPAALFYFLVRGLVDARFAEAMDHGRAIARLEQRLGIFRERDLQELILRHDLLVAVVNWIYIWVHWPIIALTLAWLLIYHRGAYAAYRNAMLLSGAIGILIFALYPVAPPRLLTEYGFADTITERSSSYRVLQPPALANPYAAMPSLHFGWNLLMGIAWYRASSRRSLKLAGIVMPVAMLLGIVLTANHFILDGVAGGLLVLCAYGCTGWWRHITPESDGLSGVWRRPLSERQKSWASPPSSLTSGYTANASRCSTRKCRPAADPVGSQVARTRLGAEDRVRNAGLGIDLAEPSVGWAARHTGRDR